MAGDGDGPPGRLGAACVTGLHPARQLGDDGGQPRHPGARRPRRRRALVRRARPAPEPHRRGAGRLRPRRRPGRRRGAAPGVRRPGPHAHPHRPHPTPCEPPTGNGPARRLAAWVSRKKSRWAPSWARSGSRRTAPTGRSTTWRRAPSSPGHRPRRSPRCAATTARWWASGGWGWRRPGEASPRCGSTRGHGAAASPRGCCARSPAPPTGPGAASLHLQTDTDNPTALALYERHGFERHHAYVNLSRAP